jgi:monothiol glutaredoxin
MMLRFGSRVAARRFVAPAAVASSYAVRFTSGQTGQGTATTGPSAVRAELATQLKEMIHKDRVVVFLTGKPNAPRCGFTSRMVSLLNQFQVPYSYVDIMEDDEVCEGLKVYSDWPTFPQMYVDGQLIGGFDVLNQMAKDGSLIKLMKDKQLWKQ